VTAFWIVGACFIAGALAMLLPPLLAPKAAAAGGGVDVALYADQVREAEADLAAGLLAPERFAQLKTEIERRALADLGLGETPPEARADRRAALAVALGLPLAAVLVYLQLGRPAATESVQAEPASAEGWIQLGRRYASLGRWRDSAFALRRAQTLLPANPNVLVDLADVLGMAQGKRLAGEPARLVQQALDLDPRHLKALSLAGSVAFESRDYAAARGYWQRALALVPPDIPLAKAMQTNIAQATQLEAAAR
jgi:cytochrome c-type biogenesis protein CcmH